MFCILFHTNMTFLLPGRVQRYMTVLEILDPLNHQGFHRSLWPYVPSSHLGMFIIQILDDIQYPIISLVFQLIMVLQFFFSLQYHHVSGYRGLKNTV